MLLKRAYSPTVERRCSRKPGKVVASNALLSQSHIPAVGGYSSEELIWPFPANKT
jgi:hypothetical protein